MVLDGVVNELFPHFKQIRESHKQQLDFRDTIKYAPGQAVMALALTCAVVPMIATVAALAVYDPQNAPGYVGFAASLAYVGSRDAFSDARAAEERAANSLSYKMKMGF